MSDKTVDSSQAGNGSEGQPTPQFQNQPDVQPNSQPQGSNLRDEVTNILKELGYAGDLNAAIERQIQSTKDRRFANLDKVTGRVDDLESQIARYDALIKGGMSKDDALFRMKVEDAISKQPTSGSTNSPAFGGQTDDWWVRTQRSLLSVAGVSENDPGFAEFVRSKRFPSHQVYIDELEGWLKNRRQGTPTNGALNMSGQASGAAGSQSDQATLRANYERELAEIPRGRYERVIALKNKYRQLGFDPNSLGTENQK